MTVVDERTAHGSVLVPGVTPERAYALVSDVTRTGEWSPQNTGGRWLGGATGPSVGAHFTGSNRYGWRRWSTTCTVLAADPGARFAFDVRWLVLPISRWDWTLAAEGVGTRISLTWTDRRTGPLGAVLRGGGPVLLGIRFDAESTGRNIATSLEGVRRLLSGGS